MMVSETDDETMNGELMTDGGEDWTPDDTDSAADLTTVDLSDASVETMTPSGDALFITFRGWEWSFKRVSEHARFPEDSEGDHGAVKWNYTPDGVEVEPDGAFIAGKADDGTHIERSYRFQDVHPADPDERDVWRDDDDGDEHLMTDGGEDVDGEFSAEELALDTSEPRRMIDNARTCLWDVPEKDLTERERNRLNTILKKMGELNEIIREREEQEIREELETDGGRLMTDGGEDGIMWVVEYTNPNGAREKATFRGSWVVEWFEREFPGEIHSVNTVNEDDDPEPVTDGGWRRREARAAHQEDQFYAARKRELFRELSERVPAGTVMKVGLDWKVDLSEEPGHVQSIHVDSTRSSGRRVRVRYIGVGTAADFSGDDAGDIEFTDAHRAFGSTHVKYIQRASAARGVGATDADAWNYVRDSWVPDLDERDVVTDEILEADE